MSRIAVITSSFVLWLGVTGTAYAHIKLLKPASWITEDSTGDPQKTSPCGVGTGAGTETKAITTYTAGQEISVEWTETVPHNGHFRIALARDRSELVDPKVNGSCNSAEIADPPQYPILADGLFATTTDDGKRSFVQKVTLPEGMTCDNCTLQVLQFMTPHPPSCFYYHCANLKIVAAGAGGSGTTGASGAGTGGAGGAGVGAAGAAGSAAKGGGNAAAGSSGISGAAGASTPVVSAGANAAPTPAGTTGSTPTPPASVVPAPAPANDSGCSIAGRAEPNITLAAALVLLAVVLRRRRH